MLEQINEKLSNLNQYFTLKNIAMGTAAAVAVVCAWKKYKVMWLRNETQKMANGQRQLPAPQQAPPSGGMGNAMVIGPSPTAHMYAAMQRQQQTQVPQRMPAGQTTPPVIHQGQGSFETNALRRHIERLEEMNRKLKAQSQGVPTLEAPDSCDEKGNPLYF